MKKIYSAIARLCLGLTTLLFLSGFSGAHSPLPNNDSLVLQITQVDTSQFPKVTVYVSVKDAKGEPVAVPRSQLVLTENGQEMRLEEIKGISDSEEPLTTLLVIDISGSMNAAGKLDAAKEAAQAYVEQTRPNDLTGLLTFNTRIKYEQPITQDHKILLKAIHNLKARDDTALYDALLEGIRILEGLPGRKAIIALTDGMDNRSQSNPKKVVDSIGVSGLSISTIGLGDAKYNRGNLAGLDEAALTYLAEHAGGVYGYANDAASLTNLYERYGRALQSEYALTYTSPSTLRDGVNRSLQVSLKGGPAGAVYADKYNPGGLVPEVAQPASWWLFGGLIVLLLLLLALPMLLKSLPKPQKPPGKIKFMNESKKTARIKLKS
ncbi:MAG: vWA domain-containing protein [Chloroflexota bacterium]